MIEEADRSLHDALSVLSQTVKETRVTLGGCCNYFIMAVAVDEEAKRTEGKKALAVEAFAKALRQVKAKNRFPPLRITKLTETSVISDPYHPRR